MVFNLICFLIITIILFSIMHFIDKRSFIKQIRKKYPDISPTEVINACKGNIKKGETHLRGFANNKLLFVKWVPSSKSPNASASIPFLIILSGDWSFLADSSPSSKAYLYVTLGHELAHKDHEPIYSLCKFTHNLKNHVREIRADFCGIAFAMNYFDNRDYIIQSRFKFKANHISPDKKTDHPSNRFRKECLKKNRQFSRDVIEEIVSEEEYCDINANTKSKEYIDKLERACYKGKIYHKGSF